MTVNSRPQQKVLSIDDDSAVGVPFVQVRVTGMTAALPFAADHEAAARRKQRRSATTKKSRKRKGAMFA